MTRDDLVAYCLAKPGARLDEPWEGDEVVKVGDKIFAFLGSPDADSPSLGVKCGRDAEEADELRRRHPGDVRASAYIGRYGWNSVRLSGRVPDDEVLELVDASYDAVVRSLPTSRRPRPKS
jgi:predicted DNA-binding protein (MmcQ/YjbR family)